MKYEILEHPSELRIKVYGKTLEELFSNAVLAMSKILSSDANILINANYTNREVIKIGSVDINSLLVDFLSEVLAKSQINKKVYQADFVKIHPELVEGLQYLDAKLIGYPVSHFDEDIKAVTYEDLDIK